MRNWKSYKKHEIKIIKQSKKTNSFQTKKKLKTWKNGNCLKGNWESILNIGDKKNSRTWKNETAMEILDWIWHLFK